MKIRRRIWSVAIALAMVLAFAGLLGVSQYAQAQAQTPSPSLVNGNIKVAVNGDVGDTAIPDDILTVEVTAVPALARWCHERPR